MITSALELPKEHSKKSDVLIYFGIHVIHSKYANNHKIQFKMNNYLVHQLCSSSTKDFNNQCNQVPPQLLGLVDMEEYIPVMAEKIEPQFQFTLVLLIKL